MYLMLSKCNFLLERFCILPLHGLPASIFKYQWETKFWKWIDGLIDLGHSLALTSRCLCSTPSCSAPRLPPPPRGFSWTHTCYIKGIFSLETLYLEKTSLYLYSLQLWIWPCFTSLVAENVGGCFQDKLPLHSLVLKLAPLLSFISGR